MSKASLMSTLSISFNQWPEIWQAAYRILENTNVSTQLKAWIEPLSFVRSENVGNSLRIILVAPNDFSAKWVRDHYQKDIENALSQIIGSSCELGFEVSEKLETSAPYEPPVETRSSMNTRLEEHIPTPSTSASPPATIRAPYENPFDPKYTFENFVVGASNQFAHASAIAVAEQPAKQYNPLFLYSHPGLGKTHLLHAIANYVLAKNPNVRVAYLSAERFVNELIESIGQNRMSQFRTKYRDSFDLILIDDIQFIAGKVRTEEEFFHTFNALHSSKRQIVVTSDRPPKEIEGLEERIRTRFEWGLVSDISPPEIETRIAILKAKAERDDIYLPDDVATFLATYIKSNVRELEGTLIKLQAQASLTGAEMSLEMAKQHLKMAIPEEGSHFTIESILTAVAKHFHLKAADFKSTSRTRTIVRPRQIAMYLIRKYTGVGFKEIGMYFGGKDHTTIMHAYSQIEKGIETDSSLRDAVEAIQNLL